MKSLLEVLREKELQLKVLTDQIEKLRAAARILEEEGITEIGNKTGPIDPVRIDSNPVAKKAWP